MAPELFQRNSKPSEEADIYAFGMVVYEVVTGTRQFRWYKVVELPLLTAQGLRPIKPEDPVAVEFGSGTWEDVGTGISKDVLPQERQWFTSNS